MRSNSLPTVLLLGAGITVLGALRALAQAGIPAQSTEASSGVERWSRWYRNAALGAPNIEHLLLWCRQFYEKPILVACSDSWVQTLAEGRDSLSPVARISVPSAEAVGSFLDKNRFAMLVGRSGIPAPRAFEVTNDLSSEIPFEEGRWFLKPRHSQRFFADYGVKAWWPKTRSEAKQLHLESVRRGHAMVVQEYIDGPATSHVYIEGYRRKDNTWDGMFARRRTRMYPADFGNSTAMESVSLMEVQGAVESLKTLLVHAEYHGLFSAEFKCDARDGLWKIIEVNVRPWWYVEFAARCGVNVMAALVHDLVGAPPANHAPFQCGKKMVNMYTDWAQLRNSSREGGCAVCSRVMDWLGSSCTVFTWSDPLPGIVWGGKTLYGAIARRVS